MLHHVFFRSTLVAHQRDKPIKSGCPLEIYGEAWVKSLSHKRGGFIGLTNITPP
jgi:hypothetical protein